MDDASPRERIGLLLLGAAIGAVAALLLAPESGAKTRRRIHRKGRDAADYLLGAGKDLVETCEELYARSEELAGDGARELSKKYRELAERSAQLVDEAAKIIRRAGAH